MGRCIPYRRGSGKPMGYNAASAHRACSWRPTSCCSALPTPPRRRFVMVLPAICAGAPGIRILSRPCSIRRSACAQHRREHRGGLRMIPEEFAYDVPTSLGEALALLSQQRENAKLLAGGHSLLPALKLRLASVRHLIDLSRLADLAYIREEGGTLCLGALTTHYQVESSPVLQQRCPLLA